VIRERRNYNGKRYSNKNRNRKKESPATEELSQVPFRGFRGKKQKKIKPPPNPLKGG
jgi:hypothetical protein